MSDYDPGFRFIEAGLRIDTDLIDRVRIAKRMTRGRVCERAGYAPGLSSSVMWRNFMTGKVKTIYPVQRIARALGLDIEDVLIPIDATDLRVVP